MSIQASLHMADRVQAYVRDLVVGEAVFRSAFDLRDERVLDGGSGELYSSRLAADIDAVGGRALGVLLGFHPPAEVVDRSPSSLGAIAGATPRAMQAAVTRAHARLMLRTVPDSDHVAFVRAWSSAAGQNGSPAGWRKLLERNRQAARGELVIGLGLAIRLGLDRSCLEILGEAEPGLALRVAGARWRQMPTAALIRRRLAAEANNGRTT